MLPVPVQNVCVHAGKTVKSPLEYITDTFLFSISHAHFHKLTTCTSKAPYWKQQVTCHCFQASNKIVSSDVLDLNWGIFSFKLYYLDLNVSGLCLKLMLFTCSML